MFQEIESIKGFSTTVNALELKQWATLMQWMLFLEHNCQFFVNGTAPKTVLVAIKTCEGSHDSYQHEGLLALPVGVLEVGHLQTLIL